MNDIKKNDKIINIIVFLILTLFPMIRLFDISIPLIFIFQLLILLLKRKLIIDKKVLNVCIVSTLLLFTLYLPFLYFNDNFFLKDVLFSFYPIFILIFYIFYLNVINKDFFIKLLKIFLIFQLTICVIQLFNIMNFNNIFKDLLLNWQYTNGLKEGPLISLTSRPFGTIGNPVYLAFISYLFGKVISFRTGEKKYCFISLIIILLTGARMPLIAALIIELYDNVIKKIIINPMKSILYLLVILLAIYLAIKYVPFLNMIYVRHFTGNGSILNDYSVSYRLSMFDLFFDNMKYWIFGGYGINNFPAFVDCEYILRILQFGIVNFIILIYPYIYFFKRLNKMHIYNISYLSFFIIFTMFSFTVLSNLFLMQYIILSIFILMKEEKKI